AGARQKGRLHARLRRCHRPAATQRTLELRIVRSPVGRHRRSRRRALADRKTQAPAGSKRGKALMMIQLWHQVGGYFYDVFIRKLDWWAWVGIFAQLMFTARFLVQWIASERAGHSV